MIIKLGCDRLRWSELRITSNGLKSRSRRKIRKPKLNNNKEATKEPAMIPRYPDSK